jgi:hypothetical protein
VHDSVAILFKRLTQRLPVLLAGLRRADGAAALIEGRVLLQQLLDLVARLSEDLRTVRCSLD